MFYAPRAPAFSHTLSFPGSGGDVVKLVIGLYVAHFRQDAHDSRDGVSERSHGLALAKMGPTRTKSAALCRQVSSTDQHRFSDCNFVQATTPADSSSPAGLYDGGISAAPAGRLRSSAADEDSRSRALVLCPNGGRGRAGGGPDFGSG